MLVENEDEKFQRMLKNLLNSKLPPADPMNGVNGRIGGGGGQNHAVKSNSDSVPGFYSGLGRHWPQPGEPGYDRWNMTDHLLGIFVLIVTLTLIFIGIFF